LASWPTPVPDADYRLPPAGDGGPALADPPARQAHEHGVAVHAVEADLGQSRPRKRRAADVDGVAGEQFRKPLSIRADPPHELSRRSVLTLPTMPRSR
jgi:hypothetical protein